MRRVGSVIICLAVLGVWAGQGLAQNSEVPQLIAALTGDKGPDAADALARLGPNAKTAVPPLIKALGSADPEMQWRAARALGAIGSAAAPATKKLVELLADDEASIRTQAAAALGKIAPKDATVVPALTKCIADPETHVRKAAVQALRRLQVDPTVVIPALLKVVEDSQPEVAMQAMAALADMGEPAVPPLVEALNNKKARHFAAVVISEMGPKAAQAVPALAEMVTDSEPEVRMQALIALGQIGPAAKSTVPKLIAALDDAEPAVTYGAAFALGKLRAQDAATALAKHAESEDPTLKLISTWAIARIHPDDPTAVRQAIAAISDGIRSENPHLSRTAAQALAEMDISSDAVGPAVQAALDEMDPTVIEHVMDALASVGEKAVPVLIQGLQDPKVRPAAIRALGHIGPAAKAAAPGLMAALSDSDVGVVSDAALALGSIGPDAIKAAPAIAALLSKPDPGCRYAAALALGRIGPGAKASVPALQKQVTGKEPLLAIASVWAIRRIDPANRTLAETAVPVLTKILATNQEMMRVQAAAALGDLGPAASSAVPALRKLLDDSHESVRGAATDALKKIEASPSKPGSTPGKAAPAPTKAKSAGKGQ